MNPKSASNDSRDDLEINAAHARPVDVEESRVDQALSVLNKSGVVLPTTLTLAPLARTLFAKPSDAEQLELLTAARAAGERLWRRATDSARSAGAAGTTLDDRPLYWQRLLEKREFRKYCTIPGLCSRALQIFERASRGATDLRFESQADTRILVSGFDPFGLDTHPDQSNPSGAAALALDGRRFRVNGKTAEVQAVLFPVRFSDFDQGIVEEIFEPVITRQVNGQTIDMLITLSMGRSDFDLERFPARRRSATAPDNLRVKTGADSTNPLIPTLNGAPLAGPEFVEFSLPASAITRIQAPYRVNDNRSVATLEGGRFEAQTLTELNAQTAVSGSGGGYLSNEISYRTVRLARLHDSRIAVGHIHTPRIGAFDRSAINAISSQIQSMLREAIGTAP